MTEKDPPIEEREEDLVRRAARGDAAAFARLVDRYKRGVHYLAIRMVGPEEAEDIAQEAFLRAYRALPAFRGASSFRTWLYRIARNLCLSELRASERRIERVSIEEEGEERLHPLLPESGGDAEETVGREDLARRVRALVDRLPEPYRAVLTLHYWGELRYEEVAAVMDVPLGTVKTLLHRGKRRLRDLVVREIGLAEEPGAASRGARG